MPGANFYFEAFSALSADRQIGAMGGVGMIPWSSIDRYAIRIMVVGDDFDRLSRMVRALDSAYVQDVIERSKKEKHGT